MTCERIEELLSAYLEGELSPEDRREVDTHLGSCPRCAELLGVLRETEAAMAVFPEVEPSDSLLAGLYAIPAKKRGFKLIFDFALRPALQPVYAAFTLLLLFVSFVLFVPQGQGIKKAINKELHFGYSQVEKIYAKAGSLTDDLGKIKDNVVNSLKTLNPLKDQEEKL